MNKNTRAAVKARYGALSSRSEFVLELLELWFPKRIFWENRKPTDADDLAMFKWMFHCEIRLPKAPPGTAYTLHTCLSYLIIIIRFAHEQSQPNEYDLSICYSSGWGIFQLEKGITIWITQLIISNHHISGIAPVYVLHSLSVVPTKKKKHDHTQKIHPRVRSTNPAVEDSSSIFFMLQPLIQPMSDSQCGK